MIKNWQLTASVWLGVFNGSVFCPISVRISTNENCWWYVGIAAAILVVQAALAIWGFCRR